MPQHKFRHADGQRIRIPVQRPDECHGRSWAGLRYDSAELVQQSLGEHSGKLLSFSDARDEFTRNYLSQILQITTGNVSQAARLAKRNRTDFYKLLARHDLNPDQFKTR